MSPNERVLFSSGKFLCIAVLLCLTEVYAAYTPPKAKVEPLYPRGIRLSVPHEEGITLVAYHVKFNDDFTSLEAGTIAVDIIKARNGRWTYEDRTTKLKRGDVIYYWVHVVYEGLGYNLLDQSHVVDQFFNYDGTLANVMGVSGQCSQVSATEVITQSGERRSTCPGSLLFEENFDTLNTSRWTPVEQFSRSPDYEFVVYMNSNENIEVKDGNLHIKPVLTTEKYGQTVVTQGSLSLEKCTGARNTMECTRSVHGAQILPPVISGRLNTKNSFSFIHGRIEIRAKLPRGDWLYPLITLECPYYDTQPDGTHYQIRLASTAGNAQLNTAEGVDISGHVLWAGVVATNVQEGRVQATNRMTLPKVNSNSLWANDYHVYELEWKPGSVTVKVDGRQYGEQPVSTALHKPFYINVGLAAGGHSEFPDYVTNGTYVKPWRNVELKALLKFYNAQHDWSSSWSDSDTGLHVDYIKVYAL